MKRITLAVALSALPLVAAAQAETYALDPYHTIPHFSLEYHGYGTLIGRFDKMSGKFTIDRTAKKGGLEFAIEAGMKYAIPSISDEVRLTTLFLAFRE